MGKPILVLNNVSIIQDNKQVLSEVNIEINNGEFVYLIGRTGSGKTSLIKSIKIKQKIVVAYALFCRKDCKSIK